MYILDVLYGENMPKSENWTIWRPVATQLYVIQKVDRPRKLPGSWTTTRSKYSISLQCIPWPVACSEGGACLTPFQVWVLGANNAGMESFRKFLWKICVSTTIHVSQRNLAKIGRSKVAEKLSGRPIAYKINRRRGHVRALAFRPHLADRAQNFVNVVDPWSVHVYRLWSGSAAVCRTYSGKSTKNSLKPAMQAFSLQ